jgi:hypothetical protein
MASRKFKLPGFSAYLEEIKQVTAKEAATRIVGELVFLGPWYSGEFAKNWVVRTGDKRIAATVPEPDIFVRTPRRALPAPVIPSLRGTGSKKNVGYTIGNKTVYRNVAMDLVPGRTENARQISAPQDWYRTYIEAGSLRDTLAAAVGAAAQNPRIKGFKSSKTFGPFGRLVNQ